MSTVAFRVLILAASVLMRSMSSCCVAVCSLAVLVRISTVRVRNRHPVPPRSKGGKGNGGKYSGSNA